MVDIQPFQAVRPPAELAEKVASLPYDVVDRQEAADLVKNNPYSYLHIDRSEIDLPDESDPYDEKVYQKAHENFQDFQEKGWLKKEEAPYFYIYELTYREESQTGLVVTASVEEYLENTIKKHEFTRHDKETDRINHMDATDANTSPVFLTYRDEKRISDIIEDWKETHHPVYDFESYYETGHRIWIIDDAEMNQSLQALFEEHVPALYIADGHHRTASAAKIAQQRKAEGRLSEQGNYFLSVLFPASHLTIYDYNRLVHSQPEADFIEKLAEDFEVKKVDRNKRKPQRKHVLSLYYNKQWYELKVKPDILTDDLVDDLDASLVQDYIFEKNFGIENPRVDERLQFVGGIKGLDVLEEAVDRGEAGFALALYPTVMEDLLEVADLNRTMPPKSTWFEPKLLSGLFIHELDST